MASIELKYTSTKRVRISTFLSTRGFGSQNIFQLIKERHVLVDGVEIKGKGEMVNIGSNVIVTLNPETNSLTQNNTPIKVVYEDDYILIVNKPYNLDVEPSLHTEVNNLSSMVSYYFSTHNIQSKIHLVNRLDKLTSGLVIIAKNRYIKNLFTQTKIRKKYLALVEGITKSKGVIINKIMKDEESSKRIVHPNGKECMTSYKKLSSFEDSSLCEVVIFTGRTHQIRVSMASIGHPLVNDPMYNEKPVTGEMFLRAYYLKFKHPITGEIIEIEQK